MAGKAEKREKKNMDRRKLVYMILVCAVLMTAIVAVTFAWFSSKSDIATLVQVNAPSKIAVLGPHGSAQTSIDMTYTDDDVTVDEDGTKTVHIQRVISVSSEMGEQQLEIAHTTNLRGLEFNVYAAEETEDGSISAGGFKYQYDKNSPIQGTFLNKGTGNDPNYSYANDKEHAVNFNEGDKVQVHAESLYWVSGALTANELTGSNPNVKSKYLTYYVIDITWKDITKETDIFYVFAQNVYK